MLCSESRCNGLPVERIPRDKSVYSNKSEWNSHISSPETSILTDISNGTLPQMSWVMPDALDSDPRTRRRIMAPRRSPAS